MCQSCSIATWLVRIWGCVAERAFVCLCVQIHQLKYKKKLPHGCGIMSAVLSHGNHPENKKGGPVLASCSDCLLFSSIIGIAIFVLPSSIMFVHCCFCGCSYRPGLFTCNKVVDTAGYPMNKEKRRQEKKKEEE